MKFYVTLFVLTFLVLITVGIGYRLFKHQEAAKTPGIVIILNGASASGKSTLQKELQNILKSLAWGLA